MKRAILALAAFSVLSACETSPYGKLIDERPVTLSAKQQSEVKEAVKYDLIDPDSASFRNLKGKHMTFDSGTTFVRVCGEVNGKNRMGGYTGFTPFHGEFDKSQKFSLKNIDRGSGDFTENVSYYLCK